MDEEPGIRTNTTICLGKIAKHLNGGVRKDFKNEHTIFFVLFFPSWFLED